MDLVLLFLLLASAFVLSPLKKQTSGSECFVAYSAEEHALILAKGTTVTGQKCEARHAFLFSLVHVFIKICSVEQTVLRHVCVSVPRLTFHPFSYRIYLVI